MEVFGGLWRSLGFFGVFEVLVFLEVLEVLEVFGGLWRPWKSLEVFGVVW